MGVESVEEGSIGKVRVFGPFGLFDSERQPVRLAAHSAAAVCAYLAIRWRGASRTEAAKTLWPDSDPDSARAALRTAIYRARHAAGEDAIVDESGRLRMNLDSDAFEAARRRRDRRRAPDANAAIAAAESEWAIVRHTVLEGWEDEWVAPVRDDARLLANECGTALARLHEERGDLRAALDALDGVLREVPYETQALEQAMRLEHVLHGRERALARAAEARASLATDVGLVLPDSIRRLERTLQSGVAGYVPAPCAFSDGADLALLGHMIEGSLRQGGTAVLSLLAEQAFSPVCMRHPHRTLDLIRKALQLTEGFGPERCAVIVAAITMAGELPDHDAVHEFCDALIANFASDHRLHNGSLLMKGLAYLDTLDLERAREFIERAVEGATTEDRRLVAASQLGRIEAHETRFEAALDRYRPAIASLEASDREDRWRNIASLQGATCVVQLALGNVPEALAAGAAARAVVAEGVVGEISAAAPHGLALLAAGRRTEAVGRLRYALRETHRARLNNAFILAVEYAAVALHRLGRPSAATATLHAATGLRRTQGLPRSRGERFLIETWGGLDLTTVATGPLRLQSSGALVEWIGEALEVASDPSSAHA